MQKAVDLVTRTRTLWVKVRRILSRTKFRITKLSRENFSVTPTDLFLRHALCPAAGLFLRYAMWPLNRLVLRHAVWSLRSPFLWHTMWALRTAFYLAPPILRCVASTSPLLRITRRGAVVSITTDGSASRVRAARPVLPSP